MPRFPYKMQGHLFPDKKQPENNPEIASVTKKIDLRKIEPHLFYLCDCMQKFKLIRNTVMELYLISI